MLSHTVNYPSAPPIPDRHKVDDDIPQNDSESSMLTSDVSFVRNSIRMLSTKKNILISLSDGFLSRVWRIFQASDGKHSSENVSDKEDTELTEILILGETLRQQSDSLFISCNEVPVPHEWKGSLLKRCLIGVGLLTGSGVLGCAGYSGYKYYNARAKNTEAPGKSLPLETVIMQEDHGGNLEDSFSHYAFHHNGQTNRTHHHRQHRSASDYNSVKSNLNDGEGKNDSQKDLKRANHRVIKLLYGEGLLSNKRSKYKEKMLYAVSLYLSYGDIQTESNIKALAQKILSGRGIYGENKNEQLSSEQAKSVVRYWVFQNILGTTPERYIESKIKLDISRTYTVDDIHHLLSVNSLPVTSHFNPERLQQFERLFLSIMWKNFLLEEMSFLIVSDEEITTIPLNDFAFAHLYSGSRFIKDIKGEGFSLENAILTGKSMWDLAITEGISEDTLTYYRAPTILFYATYSAGEVENENMDDIVLVNHYLNYRREINAVKKDIDKKYNTYLLATKFWLSKGDLADEIIEHCPNLKQRINGWASSVLTPEERRKKSQKIAKQYYLNGWEKPCSFAPDNLDDEYTQSTNNVANRFHDIDKYLILSAISLLPEDERVFISSPEASMHLVGVIVNYKQRPRGYLGYDTRVVIEEKTDLFSVNIDRQERIYALQAIKNNSVAYRLIRVDRNLQRYIENDIFDDNYHEGFFARKLYEYSREKTFEDLFLINKELFIGVGSDNIKSLIDKLTDRHRISLFNHLYEFGNDHSDLEKVWSVAKHFIPFYDCIEQSIERNYGEAVPTCLVDVISLIPVFGQASNMGGKFAQGLLRGFRSGTANLGKEGIKVIGKNILREIVLPRQVELISLGKNTLRVLDPGFSLLMSASSISRTFAEKIVKLISGKKEMTALAKSLDTKIAKLPLVTPGKQVTGILPGTELEIPIAVVGEKGGKNIYVKINPETGEKFGNKYICQWNGRLVPYLSILSRSKRSDENISGLVGATYNSSSRVKRMGNNPDLCSDQPSTSKASQTAANVYNKVTDIKSISPQMTFLPPLTSHTHPHIINYIKRGRKRIAIKSLDLLYDCSFAGGRIKMTICNSYGKNKISLYRFNQNIETIPAEFAQLRENIPKYNEEVLLAKKLVDDLDNQFQLIEKQQMDSGSQPNINLLRMESYLSKILKLDTINDARIVSIIKKESINRLKYHVKRMKYYFDNEIDNIYFASANTGVNNRSKFLAFVDGEDVYRRVIVMADYFSLGEIYFNLHTVILHEVSHISGTLDFYVNKDTSVINSIENFNDAALEINNHRLYFTPAFLLHYRKSIDVNINEVQLREIIKRDPVLRANIFMENAYFVADIIADFASLVHHNFDVLS